MTRCEEFLNFFNELTKDVSVPPNVKEFVEMLQQTQNTFEDKPTFTETGLSIMRFLQGEENKGFKAREIADCMGVSSRTVSGAMRKLVTGEYVEKLSTDPVIYILTAKGKNLDLNVYNNKEN